MSKIGVTMILKPYDQWCPIFTGEAAIPGVDLALDRTTPLTLQFPEGVAIGEVSFNRYGISYARGDDRLVGLPAFVLRGFRHRNFFVRVDSPLGSIGDLRGKRVGTNSWPDSGTLWARGAMRDAGVQVGDVRWVIGRLDSATPNKPPRPNDAEPPLDSTYLTGTDTLLSALADGKIDAVTTAFAPIEVFKPDGWIRRLVRDYRQVESDYHRRTGVYPAFHIIAARREFVAEHPQVVLSIYAALRRSFEIWSTKVMKFGEAAPWAIAEMETLLRDFSEDTPPFGMDSPAHQRMVATLCHEQHAQGLVETPARPAELFAEFSKLAASLG
jgi:4,5-dihydroxyphthalate decarboxylase